MEKYSHLVELFHRVCQGKANKEAITFKDKGEYCSLTYGKLWEQSEKVAGFLRLKGGEKNDHIAIVLDNSYLWPAVFFGILKIGAVAIPLNPHSERTALKQILIHSDAKVIITSTYLWDFLRGILEEEKILIVAIEEIINKEQNEYEKEVDIIPQDLAVLIYTSGTTATPKGVMLTHYNLIANFYSLRRLNLTEEEDCFIVVLPFYHAYPLMVNLIFPLLSGLRISFPENLNLQAIMECLVKTKVTVFLAVPRVYNLLYEKIIQQIKKQNILKRSSLYFLLEISSIFRKLFKINIARLVMKNLHRIFGDNLKFMISGGASLSLDVAKAFYKWGFTILEGYGLTETSPVVSFNTPANFKIGSVGKPLEGIEVDIDNPDSEGKGEVRVKGDNVFKGYYKDFKATQSAVREGWLYTGDLGYKDENGFLYIFHRKSEVIVLSNGKKINPSEVENYYLRSPYIEEICIFLKKEKGKLKDTLFAVIVPDYDRLRKDKVLQIKDRIRWDIENISRQLPSFQRIKDYIIISEKLPRTPLGKIKRYLIEQKYQPYKVKGKISTIVYPEDEILQSSLCKEAYEYLCRKIGRQIGLDENLEIDLGLDSLEQIGLLLEFQQITGLKFDNEDIFNILTVRDVLDRLKSLENREGRGVTTHSWKETLTVLPSSDLQEMVISKLRVCHKILNAFLKGLLFLLCLIFFKIKIKGRENIPLQGPLIICANHSSFLDGALIFASLPLSVVLKTYFLGYKRYFNHPFLKWAIISLRLLPIEASLEVKDTLQVCSFMLKQGKLLCIFPEGMRSLEGEIQEFKKGLGMLIKELNTAVLPVYIKDAYKAWPRYRLLPRPHRVEVHFGKVLSLKEITSFIPSSQDDIYRAIAEYIRGVILKMKEETERNR